MPEIWSGHCKEATVACFKTLFQNLSKTKREVKNSNYKDSHIRRSEFRNVNQITIPTSDIKQVIKNYSIRL